VEEGGSEGLRVRDFRVRVRDFRVRVRDFRVRVRVRVRFL